jgi:hypothetical protein
MVVSKRAATSRRVVNQRDVDEPSDAPQLDGKLGVADVNPRSMAWLEAHAAYDDVHPFEATELIKRCAVTPLECKLAPAATLRGLEYYLLAPVDALEPRDGPVFAAMAVTRTATPAAPPPR